MSTFLFAIANIFGEVLHFLYLTYIILFMVKLQSSFLKKGIDFSKKFVTIAIKDLQKYHFFNDRIILFGLFGALALNILNFILFLIKLSPSQIQIPVHYSSFEGVDKLGAWYQLYKLPLAGLFLIIVNNILSFLIYPKEKLLSFFLSLSPVFFEIFLLFQSFAFLNLIKS